MGRTYDSTYNLYTSPRILHSGASVPMLGEAWHANQVLNNSCVYIMSFVVHCAISYWELKGIFVRYSDPDSTGGSGRPHTMCLEFSG